MRAAELRWIREFNLGIDEIYAQRSNRVKSRYRFSLYFTFASPVEHALRSSMPVVDLGRLSVAPHTLEPHLTLRSGLSGVAYAFRKVVNFRYLRINNPCPYCRLYGRLLAGPLPSSSSSGDRFTRFLVLSRR